jgi:crotonobetainyl-CoA:carnitine CoA-transferase CaiB-like acyl-CoA transferase
MQVVEIAHMVAAPYATQLLCDHGADVLKIEPPDGDIAGRLGPLLPSGQSALYEACNRHKRKVVLDIRLDRDRGLAYELAAAADVVVTSLDVEVLTQAGLSYEHIASANQRVVYTEIAAFGAPSLLGTDALAQAASGLSDITGPEGGPGYRAGASVVDVATGVWTALGVMLSLKERERTGVGCHLRVALEDVALSLQLANVAMYSIDPTRIRRMGNSSPVTSTPMFGAADGRFAVTLLHRRHWVRFCEAIERADLLDDKRFSTDASRQQHQRELEAELNDQFAVHGRAFWTDRLVTARVPCAMERNYAEILGDETLFERGILYRDDGQGAPLTQVGEPLVWETGDSM